ncbi:hypothetical protein [Nocardia wallacei]|uniref:Uncharacterized protein n=1 Tax=Nocardia wallacei TaxID=480035 RepID=A0A7G1KTA1_9NOCA|nr:hypothetical protein [Nocardia wallacei]BCK58400.1 hypothetical protein NWFMUON74_61720 [Nocardia wallacei]
MSQPTNVVDLVTRQVLERLPEWAGHQVDRALADARAEARARFEEFLADLETTGPAPAAPPEVKSDARDRAQRTAIQGAVATVVVAVLLAIAGVVGGSGFDFTSGEAWKTVLGAALGAVVAAGTAYVQRLISPPRNQVAEDPER